jgi:hypothetical protein
MLGPMLMARIVKLDDGLGFRVATRKVRPLSMIAATTCPSQIVRIVAAAMLFGNDVFEMENGVRIGMLRQQAILATLSGPLPHKISRSAVHA